MPSFLQRASFVLLLALVGSVPSAEASNPQVDALVESANEAKKVGKIDVAISTLKTAVSLDPRHEGALVALGRAYGVKQDYDSAEKTFLDLLVKVPKSLSGHRFLALTYLRRGNATKALDYTQKAIALNPRDWESHHLLAEVQLAAGAYDKAVAAEQAVLALDKGNVEAMRGLMVIYRLQKKYDQAIAQAQAVLKANKNDLATELQVAALYAEKGDMKKSKKTLADIEKRGAGSLATLENVAAAYATLGAGADALRLYKKHVEKDPKNPVVQLALGTLYLLKNQPDVALKHATAAQTLAPKSAEPHRILGAIAGAKGDMKGAEASFRKALAAEPKRPDLKLALASVLAETGRLDEAITEFEAVRKQAPQAQELLQPLCQLYRQKADKTKGKDVCIAACKAAGVKPEECAVP